MRAVTSHQSIQDKNTQPLHIVGRNHLSSNRLQQETIQHSQAFAFGEGFVSVIGELALKPNETKNLTQHKH